MWDKVKNVGSSLVTRAKDAATGGRNHGIQHVGVTVSDFESAVSWYHEMFGFVLVSEMRVPRDRSDALAALYGGTGFDIRLGFLRSASGMVLEIFEFAPALDAEPTTWHRPGYTHLALAVSNVVAYKRELEAKGMAFVTDVEYLGGAHWAFGKDPDGNLIELIDLHANRLPLQYLGGIVGRVLKRGEYASYYR